MSEALIIVSKDGQQIAKAKPLDLGQAAAAIRKAHAIGKRAQGAWYMSKFFVGITLIKAKELLDARGGPAERGEREGYMAWCEREFPDISPRELRGYKNFVETRALPALRRAENLPVPLETIQAYPLVRMPKSKQAEIEETLSRIMAEDEERDAEMVGGFNPPPEAVQKWLHQHHSQLAGTPFRRLEPELQQAFQKQYKAPRITAPQRADMARTECAAFSRQLATFLKIKPRPWVYLETEDLKRLCEQITDAQETFLAVYDKRKA